MKFIVGDAVKLDKAPTNTFEVVVTQMSGDADAYNDVCFKFVDQVKAEEFAELVDVIRVTQSIMYCREVHEIMDAIRDKIDLSKYRQPVGDLIWDICGSDLTYESFPAIVDEFDVFYYDENGVKHHVNY